MIAVLIFWTVVFFPAIFVPRRWQYRTLWPIFNRLFLLGCGIRARYVGKTDIKNVRGAILSVNHRSFADTFITCNFLRRPFTIIYTNKMPKNPIFRFLTSKMGLIPLDNSNLVQQKNSLKQIVKMLNRYYSAVIFPEGKFVFDKPVGELKRGILKIAKESGAPVVPVAIYGAGIEMDFLYEKTFHTKNVYIDAGEPILYSSYNDDDKFMQILTENMQNLYIGLENKYKKV